MATQNKTHETQVDVFDFILAFVDNEKKRQDSYRLIELMREWSGFEPKMWGPSIIGFGSIHYKYASGREGDMPLLAFSPRKAEFSLYVTDPTHDNQSLLERLGKFKKTKGCIYFKKLEDLDVVTLEALCKATIVHVKEKYGSN